MLNTNDRHFQDVRRALLHVGIAIGDLRCAENRRRAKIELVRSSLDPQHPMDAIAMERATVALCQLDSRQ